MTEIYGHIVTRQTYDAVIPGYATDIATLARAVHNYAQGQVGGYLEVGRIDFFPTQATQKNRVLCNGSTISALDYPELVRFLAGADATEATLPGPDFTFGTATVAQTVDPSGTVTSPADPATDSGTVGGTQGGNVPSGGRIRSDFIVIGGPVIP